MSQVNELSLEFNDKLFYEDLINHLVQVMHMASLELLNLFSAGATRYTDMKNYPTISNIDGFWRYTVDKTSDRIIAYIGNDHWYAFISNYGSGSKMAMDNPWLQQYVQSSYFNKERLNQDMAVIARPKEPYTSPNYGAGMGTEQRVGSGLVDKNGKPKNLETTSGKFSNGHEFKYFNPQEPKYWLENGMQHIEKRLFDIIDDAMDSFPFDSDKYLKGGI